MNPRSDVDFSSPKVDLVVNLREVAFELNRDQVNWCGGESILIIELVPVIQSELHPI